MVAGIALTAMLGGAASASPLKIRNGSTVRVALAGKREAGVGLKMRSGGWQLELAPLPGAVADVLDVTEGAAVSKWTVPVENGVVLLDQQTFVAGHAYRVVVRRGSESLGSTLVYLYPPSMATRHKVTFDDAEAAGGGDDGPTIVKKPTL
ncbi:MAG TPA: hypothetical protein VHB97_06775 [Polyangia bacterium]|jgi:hypothetical protein|nr:hypothetical protein [Polyangia bacterium]